jgi:hypothetical protein
LLLAVYVTRARVVGQPASEAVPSSTLDS